MAWEEDAEDFFRWALAQGLSMVDVRRDALDVAPIARDLGLSIACADLPEWDGLASPDADVRARAADLDSDYVRRAAEQGVRRFMMVPYAPHGGDPDGRIASLAEGLRRLAPALEEADARLGLESIPRGDVACWNPAGYRRLFAERPGGRIGLNFDPANLLRARIDPARFLGEFGLQVVHAHAKDVELWEDAVYEGGVEGAEEPPTGRFSSRTWRYVAVGEGAAPWEALLARLTDSGYAGSVAVEPEDDRRMSVAQSREASARALRFLTSAERAEG